MRTQKVAFHGNTTAVSIMEPFSGGRPDSEMVIRPGSPYRETESATEISLFSRQVSNGHGAESFSWPLTSLVRSGARIDSMVEDYRTTGDGNGNDIARSFPIDEIDEVDEILSDLRALKNLARDWDDEDTPAPAIEAVDAALTFARLWPYSGSWLDVGLAANGAPVLNILDTDGRTIGAVDFLADNRFIFCFVKDGKTQDAGGGRVTEPRERRRFLARLEQFLTEA